MKNLASAVVASLLLAAALLAGPASSATDGRGPGSAAQGGTDSLAPVATVTLPVQSSWGRYTMAPDGTFWVANGGSGGLTVRHYDDEGTYLGQQFTQPGPYFVQSVGVYANRVFVMSSAVVYSWLTDGSDPLFSDAETNARFGGNQAVLRVDAAGGARVALGQNNKVGLLTFSNNVVGHPWYAQYFFGGGINSSDPMVNAMQGCVIVPGGPYSGSPVNCGTNNGKGVFEYPLDTAAVSSSVVAVLEAGGLLNVARVSLVDLSGPSVVGSFGSWGTGTGQLKDPSSIVRVPATGHFLVSDSGNNRISEFAANGAFVASYGQGVLTGGSSFETCGPGLGVCRPGIAGQYTRLDLGPDGRLYAQLGTSSTIQVLSLSGATAPPPPPGGTVAEKVRLKADDTTPVKGSRTTLTAKVSPSSVCTARKVRFQVKAGGKWRDLGRAKQVTASCKVSKKSGKVTARTDYRVLSLDAGGTTKATSPALTLKPKP